MDKHYIKTFQELNNMQSKISSIFKELLIERQHYKLSSDKLKKNLEEVSAEVTNLKIQNEKLQQGNQELRNVIYECIKALRCLDVSEINLMKDHRIVLDTLKKILSETDNVSPEVFEAGVTVKKEICLDGNENSATRGTISQDDIKREIDAIKDLQFTTQFYDVEINEEVELLNKNQSSTSIKKLFEQKYGGKIENFEKPLFVKETEDFNEKNGSVCCVVEETVDSLSEVTTPKKNLLLNSPVFKDFSNRKQENLSTGENGVNDMKDKINVKFLLKSSDFVRSPIKIPNRGNSVSPKREMSSPSRIRKKQRLDSPKKSPVNQLKKSNSRDVEISGLGVRKLTQTLLNIECFKKKSPEKRKKFDIFENENEKGKEGDEAKTLGDIDEDDVIMESPKKSEQVREDVKNHINESALMTPSAANDADLDETYISASIIKNCQMYGDHTLEKIEEEQTPVKRPNRERSSDCDSVPFFYKREAVRSRTERMKLPGHACLECNKYYENALGDVSPRKVKEILNKCSRHRDRNPPSIDDTPPGYWKPYLTASVATSHNTDDTARQ